MKFEELLRLDANVPNTGAENKSHAYLEDILNHLYYEEGWLVATDLNVYLNKRLVAVPDLAIYPIALRQEELKYGWRIGKLGRPSPLVVIDTVWYSKQEQNPLDKVARYGRIGAKEYFAFNPNSTAIWSNATFHLLGWRYTSGKAEPIEVDKAGWLWSETLQSWLVPAGANLRLFDKQGKARLTQLEANQAQIARLEIKTARLQAQIAKFEAQNDSDAIETARLDAALAELRAVE